MTVSRVRFGPLFIGALLLCFRLDSAVADAKVNTNEPIHYVETARLVEPLDPKKALEFATAFFEKKYPNNSKSYFAQKIEYEGYDTAPHPYCWEIYVTAKPGRGISLGDPFSVTLLVAPGGKVSVENEVSTWGTAK
jgi:hypothetical protein